jgi:hypothetical protein
MISDIAIIMATTVMSFGVMRGRKVCAACVDAIVDIFFSPYCRSGIPDAA